MQEIQARELSIASEAVLTVGTIHAGAAANVIPEMAEMSGTIRTYDETVRSYIKERIENIAKSVGAAFRSEVEVTYSNGCPTLQNDGDLSACTVKYLRELLGDQSVFTMGQISSMMGGKAVRASGSEDFAFVSQEVPSLMIAVAAGHPEHGCCYAQHHPKVKFAEQVLAPGSAMYAYAAMRWLEEH